jgi:hypothetical protein
MSCISFSSLFRRFDLEVLQCHASSDFSCTLERQALPSCGAQSGRIESRPQCDSEVRANLSDSWLSI